MFKTVTWPQFAMVALLLAATGGAYYFLGPQSAAVGVLTTVIYSFFSGREKAE